MARLWRAVTYYRLRILRADATRSAYYPREFALGYQPAFDGVRGVAIILVMLLHGGVEASTGRHGVTIFFTLSGFLITALLLEERNATGDVDLRRFYIRRALRLFPALAVVLVCVSIYLTYEQIARGNLLFVVFYAADLAPAIGRRPPLMGHTWSLALEERFYIFWPITLVLLMRLRRWVAPAAAIAGIVICIAVRTFVDADEVLTQPLPWRLLYFGLRRADALFVGCLLALLLGVALRLPRRVIVGFGAVGVVVLCAAAVQPRTALDADVWSTLVPFATAALLLWLVSGPSIIATALQWRPLRYTGRISYGLFLWHFPVFAIVQSRFALPTVLEWMTLASISYAVAALSFVFIEQPFLRLKRRYAPSARVLASAP